jgi:hypothetical protein
MAIHFDIEHLIFDIQYSIFMSSYHFSFSRRAR